MSRALTSAVSKNCKNCIRQICPASQIRPAQSAQIHNVKLVQLHDTLHRPKEEPSLIPILSRIALHSETFTQKPVQKSPILQEIKKSDKTAAAEVIKEASAYVQVGPLFEEDKHKAAVAAERKRYENTLMDIL